MGALRSTDPSHSTVPAMVISEDLAEHDLRRRFPEGKHAGTLEALRVARPEAVDLELIKYHFINVSLCPASISRYDNRGPGTKFILSKCHKYYLVLSNGTGHAAPNLEVGA